MVCMVAANIRNVHQDRQICVSKIVFMFVEWVEWLKKAPFLKGLKAKGKGDQKPGKHVDVIIALPRVDIFLKVFLFCTKLSSKNQTFILENFMRHHDTWNKNLVLRAVHKARPQNFRFVSSTLLLNMKVVAILTFHKFVDICFDK